jgi:hypothetical protein
VRQDKVKQDKRRERKNKARQGDLVANTVEGMNIKVAIKLEIKMITKHTISTEHLLVEVGLSNVLNLLQSYLFSHDHL